MLRTILLHLSELKAPQKLLAAHSWGRRLVSRFIAGEELDDAIRTIRQLSAEGFDVTLDHLGESVTAAAEAEEAGRAYLDIRTPKREQAPALHSTIASYSANFC